MRMTSVSSLASHVAITTDSTVSRTVLCEEGTRIVLFSFDAGQELSEHTAAMPVLLQVLSGHLAVTADGRTIDLLPGDLVHLTARCPHSVSAIVPSIMMLTMLDPRAVRAGS